MKRRSVYLSYTARDAALAERVEKALVGLGFHAFDPRRDTREGESRRKASHKAMRGSDALILLLRSPDAVETSWMPYETGMAHALGKMIFALLPATFTASDLPPDLAAQQVLDFDPSHPERAARHLADRLAAA